MRAGHLRQLLCFLSEHCALLPGHILACVTSPQVPQTRPSTSQKHLQATLSCHKSSSHTGLQTHSQTRWSWPETKSWPCIIIHRQSYGHQCSVWKGQIFLTVESVCFFKSLIKTGEEIVEINIDWRLTLYQDHAIILKLTRKRHRFPHLWNTEVHWWDDSVCTALAAKPGGLISTPRTSVVERTDSFELSSDPHTLDAPTLQVIKTEIKRPICKHSARMRFPFYFFFLSAAFPHFSPPTSLSFPFHFLLCYPLVLTLSNLFMHKCIYEIYF